MPLRREKTEHAATTTTTTTTRSFVPLHRTRTIGSTYTRQPKCNARRSLAASRCLVRRISGLSYGR
jgi:hypothetical protein